MNRPIRILELRSVWGTGGGPEKTILLGTARTDPRRFDVTVAISATGAIRYSAWTRRRRTSR